MSTLAISPKRVRLYRVLWDRWIIVLRILFDLGAGSHSVRWQAVADTLLVDKKTAQKYLQGLVRDGQIVPTGGGYMLTQAGMDVLLENEQGDILPAGGEIFPTSGEKVLGNNSQLLKLVEVVDVNLKTESTTSTPEWGKNPGEIFSPEARQALEQVSLLFDGAEVTTKGLPTYLHAEKVLGWIAYAYDQRARLNAPCGLIYSKLKDPSQPSPSIKYMRSPENFLPNDYLKAIGREVVEPEIEMVEVFVDTRPRRDETITPEIEQTFDAAMQSWEKRIDGQKGFEYGLYFSWVKGCWPVHFESDTLTLGVHNESCAQHNQRDAAPILQALLGWSVRFVVAVETEEG
jgi:predicted transcriptional regulator